MKSIIFTLSLFLSFSLAAQNYRYFPGGLGSAALHLWLDPSDESSLELDGSNYVTTLADLGPQAYSFSRQNINYGPFFDAFTQTLEFTRLPSSATIELLFANIDPLSSPASIQMIYRNGDLAGNGVPWSFQTYFRGNPIDLAYIFLPRDNDQIEYFDRDPVTYADAHLLNQLSIVSLRDPRPGTDALLSVNGSLAASLEGGDTSFPYFTDADVLFLGSTYTNSATREDEERFEGNMGEFIVYRSYLNDAELAITENYLSQKWDIALTTDYYEPPVSDFKYQLVGIGQADATDKVMASVNSSGGLGIEDLDFLDTQNNPQFILLAHDNTPPGIAWSSPIDLTINGSTEEYYRWSRPWYVDVQTDRTGAGRTFNLSFNFKDYYNDAIETPSASASYYLVYAPNASFTNGTCSAIVPPTPPSIDAVEGTVTFEGLDAETFADGYYTLASTLPSSLDFAFQHLSLRAIQGKILVEWQKDGSEKDREYELEVSVDGIHFELMAKRPADQLQAHRAFNRWLLDAIPCPFIYWRLVSTSEKGSKQYSPLAKIPNAMRCVSRNFFIAFEHSQMLRIGSTQAHWEIGIEEITLFNLQGQEISAKIEAMPNRQYQLIMDQPLSKGFYLVRMCLSDGSVLSKKVVLFKE